MDLNPNFPKNKILSTIKEGIMNFIQANKKRL